MMVFQIDGASFETADARDRNDWHVKLNQAWRNLADDRLAVWHHVVRRPVELERSSGFRSTFAGELGALYDHRVARRQLWINELFVTLVLHPGRDAGDRAAALAKRLKAARRSDGEVEVAHIRRLEEAGRDLAQYLGRYAPRRLGLYERDGLWFSEPMEVMRLVLTGRRSPVPIVFGHLGSAVYTVRAIFGRETLELRDAADARYGGVLAIKEYPATTRPGLWDDLLSVRFGFVISQSFAFLSKASARAVMERKQNQMVSARDRAASQITGLSDALDDLVSNRFVMGEHQASILVHGDTPSFRVFEPSYDFIDERLNVFLGDRLSSVIAEVEGPLRIALVLYVVLYGVAILRGAISEPVMDFAVRSLKLAFLYLLATTAAYSTFVTEPLFTGLPNALTRAVSGADTPSVGAAFDQFFAYAAWLGEDISREGSAFNPGPWVVSAAVFIIGALGEYRGGLQQGRRRLFVLWTRAVTPTGVAVALASPAADALGRSGFDGMVDTHFWDRFGGALLLSIVDDGVYTAVGQNDGASSTGRLPSDAASVALQGSVDIPPTLRKGQGAEVTIFVAQDLDFAGVYRLQPR